MTDSSRNSLEIFKCKESLTRCQEVVDEYEELLVSHLGVGHEKHGAEVLDPGSQAQACKVHLQKPRQRPLRRGPP